MKGMLVVLGIILTSIVLLAAPRVAQGSSCDGYGDCLSSSISYVRSNPDYSLYLGDSFSISLSVEPGPNTASHFTSWLYNASVFSGVTSETTAPFSVIANISGTYSITVTTTFTGAIKVGNTTVPFNSLLTTGETVRTRAFVLQLNSHLTNATTPLHQVRRNPDGSFYPFDALYINYTYSFLFMKQRPDITANVSPSFDRNALSLEQFENSTNSGWFFFELENKTGAYGLALTAKAFNFMGTLLGEREQQSDFKIIPLVIDFRTRMLNISDSRGFLLRNQDGTFYRGDRFCVWYNASYRFQTERPDIHTNVTVGYPSALRLSNSSGTSGRPVGRFCYAVSFDAAYGKQELLTRARVINSEGYQLGWSERHTSLTDVLYDPHFKSLSYPFYKGGGVWSYDKDFVLLVEYRGNWNGTVLTSNERAVFDNVSFTSMSYSLNLMAGTQAYFETTNTSAQIKINYLNGSAHDFLDSTPVKFFFNATRLGIYATVLANYTYVVANVTGYSWNVGVQGHFKLFSTGYTYQPVAYGGSITISVFQPSNANVTLTVQTFGSLKSYLDSYVMNATSSDRQMLEAFDKDLYPMNDSAYSARGSLTVLLNQTSVGGYALTISIGATNYSYTTGYPLGIEPWVNASSVDAPLTNRTLGFPLVLYNYEPGWQLTPLRLVNASSQLRYGQFLWLNHYSALPLPLDFSTPLESPVLWGGYARLPMTFDVTSSEAPEVLQANNSVAVASTFRFAGVRQISIIADGMPVVTQTGQPYSSGYNILLPLYGFDVFTLQKPYTSSGYASLVVTNSYGATWAATIDTSKLGNVDVAGEVMGVVEDFLLPALVIFILVRFFIRRRHRVIR